MRARELAAPRGRRPGPRRAAERSAWPLGARESWDHYQTDGALHATYWIGAWPRVEVSPMFMDALLGARARCAPSRSPSSRCPPIARPARSRRRSPATGPTASCARASASRRPHASARRAEATARREAELAAGHGEVRLSGVRHRVRARPRRPAARLCRGAGPCRPRAAGAAPPLRAAGRRLHLHAAACAGGCDEPAHPSGPAHRGTTRHAQASTRSSPPGA